MKLLIALMCLLTFVDLSAQAQWTNLGVVSGGGYFAPACYESSRDRVLVQVAPYTMLFDGQSWTTLTVSPAPQWHKLAHDPLRGRTVAVDGYLHETWEWDGATWTLLPVLAPSAVALCYHAGRQKVVALVRNAASSPTELHEWDGVTWSLVPSPNSPPLSIGLIQLAYDIGRDKLISFGPVVSGALTSQTWEWEAANGWVQAYAGPPWSLVGSYLVYDAARQRQVLLTWPNSAGYTQTWERTNNGVWILQSTPQLLLRGYVVHDSRRSRCILINQDGYTWSYGVPNPALFQPHGAGCPGSLGTPDLSLAAPWTLPWLGSSLDITIGHLPLSIALLAMGFQDQISSAGPLPLNLAPFGGPGCLLRVAPDATALLLGSAGTASLNLAIPSSNGLVGVRLFQQGLSFDPGFNALGAVMTNSMAGTIGRL